MFVDFLQTLFLFYKTKTFSRNIDKNEEGCYTNKEKGMRRSKTAGGTETSYVYEKGKLIREIRGSEKIDYLYGEDGIIGIKIGSEKYLYRKNVFGDVTEIYDEAGTLVGKYNYNAFGECEIETDEGGIAEKNPIRYRGYYYDEETGFYYLKTRYYDPEIGRFITIDNTSYLDSDSVNGLNLYAYCGNNPVMNVDPEGTSWWNPFSWDWGAIGRFIGGAILGIIGLGIMIGTLGAALVIPGFGFFTQIGFSTMIYGGFLMGSAFNSTIKADMDRIGWNPFNNDESLAIASEKVSFYKGMPIFRMNGTEGRSGSFLGIGLDMNNIDANTVKHEWGHGIQQGIMGWGRFLLTVGLPSWQEWGGNHWREDQDYYRRPWEAMADIFGGVTGRSWYHSTTERDKKIAKWYMAVATLFGPFAFFFLI